MNRILTVLLILSCSFISNAETITKDFSTEFNYLNDGMPSAFEVGQKVDISLGIEDTYEGIDIPVSTFSFTVEDAGFDFHSTAPVTLNYNSAADTYSLYMDGNGFNFQGMELLNINIEFANLNKPGNLGQPSFDNYSVESFSLYFYDETTNTASSGCTLINGWSGETPDPNYAQIDSSLIQVGAFSWPSSNFYVSNVGDLAQIIKLPESLIGQDLNITTDGSVDFILDGDKIVIFKTTSVPEPSTYAAIFGLCALAFVAYRKRG